MVWLKARGKKFTYMDPDDVAPYLPDSPVILEAGAFDGTDTARFAKHWPTASIHAFEPVPELFPVVERNTSHLQGVRRYQLALADHTGTATFHLSGDEQGGGNRGCSSLMPPTELILEGSHIPFKGAIEIEAITIADWASREKIDRIDFMWLDLQGMELPTLKAAGPILATTSAIRTIVSRHEFYSGCALYDEMTSWMKSQGFRPAIDRVGLWHGNMLFVRNRAC